MGMRTDVTSRVVLNPSRVVGSTIAPLYKIYSMEYFMYENRFTFSSDLLSLFSFGKVRKLDLECRIRISDDEELCFKYLSRSPFATSLTCIEEDENKDFFSQPLIGAFSSALGKLPITPKWGWNYRLAQYEHLEFI